MRDAMVRTRTGCIALIRALLRRHRWRVPTGSADTFIRRVVALPLPGRLLSEVAPLLAVMRPVNQQLAYSDEVSTSRARMRACRAYGPSPAWGRLRRLRVARCSVVNGAFFLYSIVDLPTEQ